MWTEVECVLSEREKIAVKSKQSVFSFHPWKILGLWKEINLKITLFNDVNQTIFINYFFFLSLSLHRIPRLAPFQLSAVDAPLFPFSLRLCVIWFITKIWDGLWQMSGKRFRRILRHRLMCHSLRARIKLCKLPPFVERLWILLGKLLAAVCTWILFIRFAICLGLVYLRLKDVDSYQVTRYLN